MIAPHLEETMSLAESSQNGTLIALSSAVEKHLSEYVEKDAKVFLTHWFITLIMSRDFINPTSLTITHLRNVIDKIATFREEDLSKLDKTVNTYLNKRR